MISFCPGRSSFAFHVRIEIDLVLVRESRLSYFFVRAEDYLFSMWRSHDLVFVWVVNIYLVLVCGPKPT